MTKILRRPPDPGVQSVTNRQVLLAMIEAILATKEQDEREEQAVDRTAANRRRFERCRRITNSLLASRRRWHRPRS